MSNKQDNILIISIKPQYAEKIFSGEKTIELRKSKPLRSPENGYMLIYVTSPIKEIWGICKIENIIKDNTEIFWEKFGNQTGVSLKEFNEYYNEKTKALGIKLKDIKKIPNQNLSLKKLKEIIPGFTPPQTYKYLSSELKKHNDLKELFT